MATLATIVSRLPQMWQFRYKEPQWIDWINELLERLSGEGMMRDLIYETGLIVERNRWVSIPTGLRVVERLGHPTYDDLVYGYNEIDGRLKLDREIDSESSQEAITAFSSSLVGSIKVDIDNISEDQFENYLLVITAGTLAGSTYLISGNDASSSGTTKIYYQHELNTALDTSTGATAGYLTGPDFYVLLRYRGSYTEITDDSQEVQISNDFERRITSAWLRYKCEYNASRASNETTLAKAEFEDILSQIQSEMLKKTGKTFSGRYLPGMLGRTTY